MVMGVLNATPDSFSDGGRFLDPDIAIEQAKSMIRQGADIIDVGGESSRPGAVPVEEGEEIRRVLPVVEALSSLGSAAISIDTTKSAVAGAALAAGAHIVNDISAGLSDCKIPETALSAGAGYVLMHMQGTPGTMQACPRYKDAVTEVCSFLRERVLHFRGMGFGLDQLVVDPGIGFGKNDNHNLELLRGLEQFATINCPLMVGVSRKSFIGRILGREMTERLAGGLAAALYAVERGARIIRTHDVKETCDILRMMRILCEGGSRSPQQADNKAS